MGKKRRPQKGTFVPMNSPDDAHEARQEKEKKEASRALLARLGEERVLYTTLSLGGNKWLPRGRKRTRNDPSLDTSGGTWIPPEMVQGLDLEELGITVIQYSFKEAQERAFAEKATKEQSRRARNIVRTLINSQEFFVVVRAEYWAYGEKVFENILEGTITMVLSKIKGINKIDYPLRPGQRRKGEWRMTVARQGNKDEVKVETYFLNSRAFKDECAQFFAQFLTDEEVQKYGK